MPLLNQLNRNSLIDSRTIQLGEELCEKLDDIFPVEPPSLLHGDLWSGNFMVALDGNPCLYDPAVYYGHREMDLGMTKLFGGFDNRFYDAYHEAFPLERNWEWRIELTQLYPLLVHAILFGGQYVPQVIAIIHKFG
jgi:fructosamine-3-kinase